MPTINPTLPNDGEDADAIDISGPILAILSVINGNIDQDNVKPGSLPWSVMGTILDSIEGTALKDDANVKKYRQEAKIQFIASGLDWAALSGLNATMSGGTLYTSDGGRAVVAAIATRAFTATKDTYVSIGPGGSVSYQEVTVGAAAPTLATNYVWLAKVVTSGSAITSIVTVGGDSNGNVYRPSYGEIQYTRTFANGTWGIKKTITLTGNGMIAGVVAAELAVDIAFPIKFKSPPTVVADATGYKSPNAAFDPAGVADDWSGQKASGIKVTRDGFKLRMRRVDGSSYSTGTDYYYTFICVGEVN